MTAVSWSIGYPPFYPGRLEPQSGFTLKTTPCQSSAAVSKVQQEPLHSFGKRGGIFDDFPEIRMDERERGRVQGISVERRGRARVEFTVHRVADDRMAQRCQMNTDLVGASGLEANLEQREVGEPLEHSIAGDRSLAAAGRANRHLHPVPRVAPDRSVYDP